MYVLDLASVHLLKQKSHLPITVDPSHATGIAALIEPCALGAIAVGAHALEIEVHIDPEHAWSDGAQSLTPAAFAKTMDKIRAMAEFCGRSVDNS